MARPKKQTYNALGLKDDDLEAVERKVFAAVRYHDDKFKETDVNRRYYGGQQYAGTWKADGDHFVTVNRILPNIELKVDTVAYSLPEFIEKPRTEQGKLAAPIGKAALSYYFDTERLMAPIKDAWRDAKISRFGVVYVGWRFETEDLILENDRKPTDADALDPQRAAELASEGQDPFTPVPQAEVHVDAPSIRRINPANFMLEPGAGSKLQDARFVVWREEVPLDEIKRNSAYDPAVTAKLKGDPLYGDDCLPDDIREMGEDARPDDTKCVTLWHYFEKARRLHCVSAKEAPKKWLLVEKWKHPFKDYPFELIVAHELPDKNPSECVSDVDLILPLQDAVNQTRSRQVNHVEQFNEKYQTRTGNLTPASRRQMRSSRRGMIVEHNGSNDNAIFPLQTPPIQPEVYAVEDRSMRDIDYMLGVSDYQRNQMPSGGRRTATEVATLQQTGSSRVDGDQRAFDDFLGRITAKVLQLLQEFAYHTRSIPIYGQNDQVQSFVDMNVDSIKGEYDILVKAGSTRMKNEEADKQNAIFLLQTLTPYAQMVDPMTQQPVINLTPLIRELVKKSGVEVADEILGQMQPPMAPPMPGMQPGMDPAMGGMAGAPMDPMAQSGQGDAMKGLAALIGAGGM
jgi:hypothetical protein